MNKYILLASGAMVLAAAVMAWSGWRIQQEALAAQRSSANHVVSAREQLQRTEERAAAAKREETQLKAKLEHLRAAQAVPTKSPASKSPAAVATETAEPLSPAAARLKELEAVAKTKGQIRDLADNRRRAANVYQSFFRELKLTPKQIESFLKIRAMRSERETDLGDMQRQGLITAEEREKMRAASVPKEHAAFRELLGEAGFQRLLEYNHSTSARDMIGSFAASAALAGVPFTAGELQRLVDVMVASHAPQSGGSWWDDRMFATWQFQPIDWQLAEPRLRALMTEAQWKIFTSENSAAGDVSSHFFNKFRTLAYQAHKADRAAEIAAAAAARPGK